MIMPAGNRTGPWGYGPMTGRGFGYCAGFPAPGFMFPGARLGFGRGFGRGLGFGRGRGFRRLWFGGFWGYPQPYWSPFYSMSSKEEETVLSEQAAIVEKQLGQIKARLTELRQEKKEKKT
jgi:hypothetical protein